MNLIQIPLHSFVPHLGSSGETRSVKVKVKLIKKDDRNVPASTVETIANVDQKELSTTVKEWVSEFQERRDGALVGFDSLFDDSKP